MTSWEDKIMISLYDKNWNLTSIIWEELTLIIRVIYFKCKVFAIFVVKNFITEVMALESYFFSFTFYTLNCQQRESK